MKTEKGVITVRDDQTYATYPFIRYPPHAWGGERELLMTATHDCLWNSSLLVNRSNYAIQENPEWYNMSCRVNNLFCLAYQNLIYNNRNVTTEAVIEKMLELCKPHEEPYIKPIIDEPTHGYMCNANDRECEYATEHGYCKVSACVKGEKRYGTYH